MLGVSFICESSAFWWYVYARKHTASRLTTEKVSTSEVNLQSAESVESVSVSQNRRYMGHTPFGSAQEP